MSILDDLDLSAIEDERIRQCIVLLLNLVEQLKRENAEQRAYVHGLQIRGEKDLSRRRENEYTML